MNWICSVFDIQDGITHLSVKVVISAQMGANQIDGGRDEVFINPH